MKKALFFFLLLFLTQCKEELPPPPVEPSKMELIIFDLMIMESAVTKVPEAEKDSLMNLYSNQLLEIHGIDQEGLDSMMNYLKINQEMASELFQNVNIRLDTFKKRN